MSVQLSLIIGNNDDLVAQGYTHIEIWASEDDGNVYAEITSAASSKASLASSPASTLFRMGGHMLKFSIDAGAEVAVLFDSLVQYWSPSQVAAQINVAAPGIASVVNNTVVLTSPTIGRVGSVGITYNDADDLGFVAGTTMYGTTARIPLVQGTFLYQYLDISGDAGDFYKWRFSKNGSVPISDFSDAIVGDIQSFIASGNLAVMTGRFVDYQGRPQKTRVIIAPDGPAPQQLSGYTVGGVGSQVFETDENGYLAVPLVRGLVIRVAIEGTPLVRTLTVPNTTSFDLLSAMSDATDPFSVQFAPPLLTRMNP